MDLKDNLGATGDDFYAALIATHDGLSESQSHALNARLVLIMANEIGDLARLAILLKAARKDATG
ncbi:Protein of unknown function [Sulfitobacter brevis]|uniref:DUF2783 domain-containing protein n=1 Tax=Sulfitobacter brevis TaxID=74348 RepID=A0A1I2DCI5_9RHOB|nr:DUF2783 domain-containing protein [Sulfitobacter brevis]SFE78169.1 Protein of unknown function [Sulfitobacter brevis]